MKGPRHNKTPGFAEPGVSGQTDVRVPNSVPNSTGTVNRTPRQTALWAAQDLAAQDTPINEIKFRLAQHFCEVWG